MVHVQPRIHPEDWDARINLCKESTFDHTTEMYMNKPVSILKNEIGFLDTKQSLDPS